MLRSFNSVMTGWVVDPIRLKLRERRNLQEEIKKHKKIARISSVVYQAFKTYAGQHDITDNDVIRNMWIKSHDLESLSHYIDFRLDLPGPDLFELQPYGRDQMSVDPKYHPNNPHLIRTVGDLVKYLVRTT